MGFVGEQEPRAPQNREVDLEALAPCGFGPPFERTGGLREAEQRRANAQWSPPHLSPDFENCPLRSALSLEGPG